MDGQGWIDTVFEPPLDELERQEDVPSHVKSAVLLRLSAGVDALELTGVLSPDQVAAARARLARAGLVKRLRTATAVKDRVVPDLHGMSLTAARASAVEPGLELVCHSVERPGSVVVRQEPRAGAVVSAQERIDVWLSQP